MADDMVIFTRCFDLLAWLMPKAETFPRAYRLTGTQRLMNAALDLQEALIEAQSHRDTTRRLEALGAADTIAALPAPRASLALA